jgi:hypothetical protein
MIHWEKLKVILDTIQVPKSAGARTSACAQPI